MFDVLKQKLSNFKKNVGEKISIEKAKAFLFEQEIIIEEKSLEEPLYELELALLESDVALSVAEEIVSSVKKELVGKKRKLLSDVSELAQEALRKALYSVLNVNGFEFYEFIKNARKPVNIVFVGVNGTGKTTTIAKVAYALKQQGYKVVIAAADTYRTGAIEQIEEHASNIGVKVIKHPPGGDPAAVIYDAIQHAKATGKDVVLADTAGRMHVNINLMDQLKKICRVTNPDLVIFVDEAIAGNDAVERAKMFNNTIGFTGAILTKVDADAKGGAAVSIAYVTKKPILFLGIGQRYEDLQKFDVTWLVDRLLS
ncbi:MAG: signal recognition particle-docking protein FtsY [Methanocellales archaeon]